MVRIDDVLCTVCHETVGMPANRFEDVCYPCEKERERREGERAYEEYAEYMDGEGRYYDSKYITLLTMRQMLGISEREFWRRCLANVKRIKAEHAARYNNTLQRRGESE